MTFVNFLTNFQRFKMLFISFLFIFCGRGQGAFAQSDSLQLLDHSPNYHSKRVKFVKGGTLGLGTALLGGLSYSWYSNYNTGAFHFFNDAYEWRGMDKIGHVVTAYQVSDYLENWYHWSGMSQSKSMKYSAITSFSFLAIVEVMDGFSQGWGFSWFDMVSNGLGVGAFLSKSVFGNAAALNLKYGYVPSIYRVRRPDLLGENSATALIKDYNAQSYWLSINLATVSKSDKIPSWLNLAVGYGAEGLLGANDNPVFDYEGVFIGYAERYSQFLLSPDIAWNKIKTPHKGLKFLFRALSFYKFPFPTLAFNSTGKFVFHWWQ